jgi:O-antigen/teichoic acid export membrane protein
MSEPSPGLRGEDARDPGLGTPNVEDASPVFDLVRRAASAVALPLLGGLGLSFVTSIVLARWLGAAEFGTYTYILSWVTLLGLIALFGLDATLVSQLPRLATTAAWGHLGGLLRWANAVTLVGSLCLAGLVILAGWLIVDRGASGPATIWLVAGGLVALTALMRVQQASLRGLHRPVVSQVPDSIVTPIVMLACLLLLAWTGFASPTAEHALIAFALAVSVALTLAAWLVYRAIPNTARRTPPRYRHRAWIITSGRLFLLASLTALNGRVGILMLGVLAAPQVVGPYAAALRYASFISLALNITVLAMAPTIAGAHAAGQVARIRLIGRQMTWIALGVGIPIALALILFGRWLLMLFGPGFEIAQTALVILALGEVVNVAAGPVATLLVMTGHERDAILGLAVGTGLNAGLGLILVPQWGINGAAVATATGVMVWNLLLRAFVRRRLKTTWSTSSG